MRPYSRGRIQLGSDNPQIQPRIHTNYLSDYRDVQVLVEGNRKFKVRKLWNDYFCITDYIDKKLNYMTILLTI